MNCKHIIHTIAAMAILTVFNCPALGGDESFCLTLVKLPENRILLSQSVKGGDRFYIDYIHSLDKTPILDTFLVSHEGVLVLEEEQYEWYGAGLAFHPQGKGRIRFNNDHTQVLINRPYDPFYLRVGSIANHTLTVNSQKIPLLNIADKGDLLAFSIEKMPTKEHDHDKQ